MSRSRPSHSAARTPTEPRSPLDGAAVVTLREPIPVVKTSDAGALAAFVRFGAVDVPGAYVAYWRLGDRVHAYVGQSGVSVANRLHDPKFRHVVAPERIITVTDRDGRLTSAQTRVIERILHLSLTGSGVPVLGDTPSGAVVPSSEYAMLRAFCAGAIRQIQAAGLGFQNLSARDGLAGPVTEPGIVLDTEPNGKRFRLDTKIVAAKMIETVSGFVITAGSIVRNPGHAPRTRTVGVVRLELLYAGHLQVAEDGRLRVLRPLMFPSVSAATRFVTGHEGATPSLWTNIDDADTSRPRRTRKVRSARPVLTNLVVSTTSTEDTEHDTSDARDLDLPRGGFRHD